MIRQLVLMPGMDGTGDLFGEFAGALPDTFRAVTIRYPADVCLGYQEMAHLVSVAVPISEPYVLLAESFSTPLAIQFAATNPPNLKGLILCAGFAASPVQGWRRLLALLAGPVLFRLGMPGFASLLLVGQGASVRLVTDVKRAIAAVEPKVLAARLRTVLSCDVRPELGRLTLPILYLQAAQDRLVPASCLEEIKRIQPQKEVVSIEGPHLLIQREPQRTAATVTRFVFSLPES
jgi:pimeloyl-ACP methyl ester carboxylesterase